MKKLTAVIITIAVTVSAFVPYVAAEPESFDAGAYFKDAGILKSYPDGELHMDNILTRAEAAVILSRAAGYEDALWYDETVERFDDVERTHWASGYIYRAAALGFIDGTGNGKFEPESMLTCVMWARMLLNLYGCADLDYPSGVVKKAKELGIMTKAGAGEYLTRQDAVEMLYKVWELPIASDGEESVLTIRKAYESRLLGERGEKVGFKDYSSGSGAVYAPEAGGILADAVESTESPATLGGGAAGSGVDFTSSEAEPIDDWMPVMSEQQPEPKAGQITAGSWCDNDNWDYWQRLMTEREFHTVPYKWGLCVERYEVTVRDNGIPVRDVKICISFGEEKIWQAVTDKNGRAYLFVDGAVGAENNQGGVYTVTVGDTIYENITLDPEVPLEFEFHSDEVMDIVDLMFTIDTTGSMGDELQYIKEELKDVVSRIDSNVRVSCNYYRDHDDAYVVKPFDFSTDVEVVQGQISKQYAAGGGDYPEAVDEAIDDAVNAHDWSPSARARILFLVLDAPPHEDRQGVAERLRDSVKAAAEKGIRIVPVASSGIDKDTEFLLRSIAVQTGGTYVFLTDDSGIGYSHIEPTVGDFEVKYLNEMILEIINGYIGE